MINEYVKDTCKMGQGHDCCRFLIVGPDGFECAKFTQQKDLLDFRAETKQMTAQADNCDGLSTSDSIIELN